MLFVSVCFFFIIFYFGILNSFGQKEELKRVQHKNGVVGHKGVSIWKGVCVCVCPEGKAAGACGLSDQFWTDLGSVNCSRLTPAALALV